MDECYPIVRWVHGDALMQFSTAYDVRAPEAMPLELLLHKMYMEEEILIDIPGGRTAYGVLVEVNPTVNRRIVELTFEIDDSYATAFYIDHDPDVTSLVQPF